MSFKLLQLLFVSPTYFIPFLFCISDFDDIFNDEDLD